MEGQGKVMEGQMPPFATPLGNTLGRITRHIDSVHVDTGDCVGIQDYSRQRRLGRYSSWVR